MVCPQPHLGSGAGYKYAITNVQRGGFKNPFGNIKP